MYLFFIKFNMIWRCRFAKTPSKTIKTKQISRC